MSVPLSKGLLLHFDAGRLTIAELVVCLRIALPCYEDGRGKNGAPYRMTHEDLAGLIDAEGRQQPGGMSRATAIRARAGAQAKGYLLVSATAGRHANGYSLNAPLILSNPFADGRQLGGAKVPLDFEAEPGEVEPGEAPANLLNLSTLPPREPAQIEYVPDGQRTQFEPEPSQIETVHPFDQYNATRSRSGGTRGSGRVRTATPREERAAPPVPSLPAAPRKAKANPTPLRVVPIAQSHGGHAWCDADRGRCVPATLHAELCANLGHPEADAQLRAWYPEAIAALPLGPVLPADVFRFWKDAYDAAARRGRFRRPRPESDDPMQPRPGETFTELYARLFPRAAQPADAVAR